MRDADRTAVFPALYHADYVHPREVAEDVSLSAEKRREILAAWASDACAVGSKPGYRWLPGTPGPVSVGRILAALRSLDQTEALSPSIMGGAIAQQARTRRTQTVRS